jgi:chromosomal replication initiator protein
MSTYDKKQLWHEVLESIKVSVSSANFSAWFSQTHLASIKKNKKRYVVEIGCASPFAKVTIEKRYFGLLQDSLSKSLNSPCDISFIIKQKPNLGAKNISDAPLFDDTEKQNTLLTHKIRDSGLRPLFTFENFAVSSSNQMAHAAAEAVSKNLGSAYNPLFIWGGVGVGKTHLMNSVGYSVLTNNTDAKIHCCTGEQFTNDIVEGIRHKSTDKVRAKYRKLNALLIDDIQFIAGKDTIQEEFFHTFNSLVTAGAQIILTSDKPPSDISKLEERLRSRFEAGLIVDITQPDFELRCAIVQIKAKEKNINLEMDQVQLIAGNIDAARKIEGFLVKILTETNLKKTPLTNELIETLLGKGLEEISSVKSTPHQVISVVSKYFSIKKRSLLGSSRIRPIARPRQILMYILRTQLGLPLQEVGRIVGGRDHTTVMHAVDKITHLASENVDIREDIRGIKNML